MAFSTLFRCKWLGDGSKTLSEMAEKLEAKAKELREMEAAGVKLDGPVQDDYAELVCNDATVAEKYGLEDGDKEDEEDEELPTGDEEEDEFQ